MRRTYAPIRFVLAALAMWSTAIAGEEAAKEGDAAATYLFTSFRGNGEDGLHLAYSRDGLRWTSLNNDRPLVKPTVGKAKLMRDPCIVQGPDRTFHMVWTVGWWERSIGYATSADLIRWSPQRLIPMMEHEPKCKNAWAPELFYDESEKQWLIIWSSTVPGRFPETDASSESGSNHRMYFTTTRDFKKFTPTKLFLDPGFNVIDGTIVKVKDQYHLIFKDERLKPTPQKNLRIATGDRAVGPYRQVGEPFTPSWVEGPSVLRIGNEYIVYFDMYRKHRYGALRTRDLVDWTDITDQLSFPRDHRHGTAFEVQPDVIERLLRLSRPADHRD
ncbi:MAG: glycoside hydrolase family 43 protein [Planctomycetes bacterium]|nr:glycoside hydrolase family 43 protein [Planctomycetota bacterium]MBL7043725.1 glycoside hydrolase family 43 protein [Pirellulaceae bacterium]